jgi:uncharacterized membrane protein
MKDHGVWRISPLTSARVPAVVPVIRRIEVDAIREALEKGVSDFWAMLSHAAFLALVYPLCGMVLAYASSYQNALQLIFPLASGFALVGPFVDLGVLRWLFVAVFAPPHQVLDRHCFP